ncbi:MAG: DegV family protein [Patescibacteria group bacterium]
MIGLVTDSAADLPTDLARANGISVVPLEVRLGTDSFRDGDLATEEFFRRVRTQNIVPKTSQPPVGAFVQVYQELLSKCKSIISIHIASTLSGTYDAANVARQSLPGADISVVDSRSVSLGLGLLVLRAARAIEKGLAKDAVVRAIEEVKRRIEVLVALDTLDFLERGGRIGKVAAFLGSLLNLKPLVKVVDGQVLPVTKARSRIQALDALLGRLEAFKEQGKVLLGVMHTIAAEEAEQLRRRVQDALGLVEMVVQAGPVLGAHGGPGALAVAVVPE